MRQKPVKPYRDVKSLDEKATFSTLLMQMVEELQNSSVKVNRPNPRIRDISTQKL